MSIRDKIYWIIRLFHLTILFIINGMDYIIFEDRKIYSFSYVLSDSVEEKKRKLKEKRERLKNEIKIRETNAFIDYLNGQVNISEEGK